MLRLPLFLGREKVEGSDWPSTMIFAPGGSPAIDIAIRLVAGGADGFPAPCFVAEVPIQLRSPRPAKREIPTAQTQPRLLLGSVCSRELENSDPIAVTMPPMIAKASMKMAS